MKNFPVKFKRNFKNFCRTARKVLKTFWRKSKEILMKFGKLGVYTMFLEKLCKFFVQLADRGSSEEFQKKFYGNFEQFCKNFAKTMKLEKLQENFEMILRNHYANYLRSLVEINQIKSKFYKNL